MPAKLLIAFILLVSVAAAEPPAYKLGKLFPPPVRDGLRLTPEQARELEAVEKELGDKLAVILTPEQRKLAEGARPGFDPTPDPTPGPRLTLGGILTASPVKLTGDAAEGVLGDARREYSGRGIRLLSGRDANADGVRAGAAWTVSGLKPGERWYRVRVRGLAQDHFRVENGNLYLKVNYFKDAGTNPLDGVAKQLDDLADRHRTDLLDPGTNKNLGAAVWQTFSLVVRTPFAEVDTLGVSVGFTGGTGTEADGEFWIAEVEVSPVPEPADYLPPAKPTADKNPPALKSLVKLGGRWYYDPRGGSKDVPEQFDHTNADRLLYRDDKLSAPFAGNTSAWLRKGYYDRDNVRIDKERLVPDNVVISFTDTHLVMRSKNLPNHPTAVFPDRSRFLDGNPNVIREQAHTWQLPLEPKANPKARALTRADRSVMPRGPIGVAVNGVVFFDPFDADADPALWRLDRCCGHPSPSSEYHYHKYPACLNTPWDDGTAHSPLIGFAFDGFPVYGPYESAGTPAKDLKANALNAFNLHTDEARGPHYHVTPGKFPYILGGYWGEAETRRRGPR